MKGSFRQVAQPHTKKLGASMKNRDFLLYTSIAVRAQRFRVKFKIFVCRGCVYMHAQVCMCVQVHLCMCVCARTCLQRLTCHGTQMESEVSLRCQSLSPTLFEAGHLSLEVEYAGLTGP